MMRRSFVWRYVAGAVLAGATMVLGGVAGADELKISTKAGKFDDVKADVADAVIARGLTIDYRGNIGGMLDRTGADVGSSKKVYAAAEFITFCSAKLSRAMMEADPRNLAYCPYVVFTYEDAAKPGQISVGYRRPAGPADASDAAKKALADIDALLGSIVTEATK